MIRARRGRRRAAIERADTEAKQIKGPQQEEKGGNRESGYRGYTDQRPVDGRRRATIKKADTEAIQVKGPSMGGEGRQ